MPLPAIPPDQVLTGARARLSIKGQVVGFATNVSVTERTDYEPIEVLGRIEVLEHAPVGYSVSMSAGFVRLVNYALRSAGVDIAPKIGQDAEQHLANIYQHSPGGMEAVIEDPISGQAVMVLTGVRVTEHTFNVSARSLWSENVSFVAIRHQDETEA